MKKILKRDEAQRLFDWLIDHGHTAEEANEAIAYVIGIMEKKKENPKPSEA